MAPVVTEDVVEQDVDIIDLGSLVDDLYADEQVERPGIVCEIAG
jgi:hypothetical protein